MKGRSLWPALMLAWLSAANAPNLLPVAPPASSVSVSGQGLDGEAAIAAEIDVSDVLTGIPVSGGSVEDASNSTP